MIEQQPLAKRLKSAYKKAYKPQPLIERIHQLLEEKNENYREASLRAGLDNASIQRILSGQRPSLTTCVYLANHFEVNPNEFLELALWPRLEVFDVSFDTPGKLPIESVDVAMKIAKISDPKTRRKVADAIMVLLEKYFDK
jgi:hypothetical protein